MHQSTYMTAFLALVVVAGFPANGLTLELPRTGQIKCYASVDPYGEIPCAGTGQDGEIRAGTAIPNPHFSDNGDGTITDDLTGLVWLKDLDCFPNRTWGAALADVALLADGQCGLSDGSVAGEWRVPNVVELGSLFNGGRMQDHRAYLLSVGFAGTPSQNAAHWSSTTDIGSNHAAYALGGGYGGTFGLTVSNKYGGGYGIAVKGAGAWLWKSGQTTCYEAAGAYGEIPCAGTGQDGEYQMGAAWPDPRFLDNGDGTVTDDLTGLVWLENANCLGNLGWDAALAAAKSLADGQCGLSDGSTAGQWRMPNRTELFSLVDYGAEWPKIPAGHPFVDVPTGYGVGPWTSTSYPSPTWSWYVMFGDTCCGGSGAVSAAAKGGGFASSIPLWPVRDGAVSSLHPDITVTDDVAPADDLLLGFGDQAANTWRDRTLTLTNEGAADLVIGTIAATDPLDDPFSIADDACSGQTLPPLTSCSVTVRCAPTTAGAPGDTFDIPSNDTANPSLTFSVGGHAVGCGDTDDDGRITATDALVVLQTAVGSNDCRSLDVCICDVDGANSVTATDALGVLKFAVGIVVSMDCTC